jgi:hypothetical protein
MLPPASVDAADAVGSNALEATNKPAVQEWWSLRPLVQPEKPRLAAWAEKWARTPIDAFIAKELDTHHLTCSPEADRTTLIRRLYFDLVGLLPGPERVCAFVQDRDPRAYENLVEELLASPQYGERWARHWLDIVHYGDSHGFDKDKPRPNAWPYRDYVIRAFNQDKAYGRFIQEQLAGDVLAPDSAEAIQATGFMAAGPWDAIGQLEVPETKVDGQIARHLDRDDMVATTMQTFISMTAQCAQCHKHKFDPITQEDYYSLQADFAAIDRADRPYDDDPAIARRRSTLAAQQHALERDIRKARESIRAAVGPELDQVEKRLAELKAESKGQGAEFGYHSRIEGNQASTKWVQIDLGRAVSISQIVAVGCHDDFNDIGAGFGFPARFKLEVSNDPEFHSSVRTVADHTQADFPNPNTEPQQFTSSGEAQYVRFTATKLAPRLNDYIFALAELMVLDSRGTNLALHARVTALDATEAPPRWQKENLVDGKYYGLGGATNQTERLGLEKKKEALLHQVSITPLQEKLAGLEKSLQQVEAEAAQLPKPHLVYAGKVHYGSGNFAGTGPNGGKPRVIHVLSRGDVRKPKAEVGPGALACVTALPARFDLPPGAEEGQRRLALAQWISDERNPLTWRSVVNRMWQYHLGRGLVDTPNDFGRMGQKPSHPELLDWLAAEFRDGGQSLKQLHRLIVTSAVYRQSCADRAEASAIDAENQFLWRMNRRQLEAEELRDAVLAVSGMLDGKMYGPGFQDFVIEKPDHSPHYRYDLYDPEEASCHRRSIYRFIIRSQPQPFMATLDCADPSILVGKRNQSVTPIQALALLNDRFMLVMSKHLAARLQQGGGDLPGQIDRASDLAFGRKARTDEREACAAYAQEYGLPNTCRMLLNLNEFMFID